MFSFLNDIKRESFCWRIHSCFLLRQLNIHNLVSVGVELKKKLEKTFERPIYKLFNSNQKATFENEKKKNAKYAFGSCFRFCRINLIDLITK